MVDPHSDIPIELGLHFGVFVRFNNIIHFCSPTAGFEDPIWENEMCQGLPIRLIQITDVYQIFAFTLKYRLLVGGNNNALFVAFADNRLAFMRVIPDRMHCKPNNCWEYTVGFVVVFIYSNNVLMQPGFVLI